MHTKERIQDTTSASDAGQPFSAEITGPIPIGHSVSNYKTYFFDKWLGVCPIGVPGELCIGGPSLAQGYLGKPALTAQTFVPDPASIFPGDRVYRSGDMGCYSANGDIVFMGRLDRQVKIRGFRIEPGEIEVALVSHVSVRQAHIVVRNDRLDAYVEVGQSPAEPVDSGILMKHIRGRLPDFMIPAAIVVMEAFPLTPNRKIDVANLPDPEHVVASDFEAPRDPLEMQLALAFAEVLNLERVGLNENFFELGGHSLMILSLVSAIRERLDIELPVPLLFQSNTVAALAAIIREHGGGHDMGPLVDIKITGSKNPLFLVHAVGGEALGYAGLGQQLDPDRPLFGFEARGLQGDEEPIEDLEDIAAFYVEAMREEQPEGPYLLGGWSLGGVIALEMARQLKSQGQSISLLVMLDTWLSVCNRECSDVDLLLGFLQDRVQLSGANLEEVYKTIMRDKPQDHLGFIEAQIEKYGLEMSEFELSRLKRLYQTSSANTRAAAKYTPQPYDGPILLFQETDHHRQNPSDPRSGTRWLKIAPQIQIHDTPGSHYSMLSHPPHLKELAESLNKALSEIP